MFGLIRLARPSLAKAAGSRLAGTVTMPVSPEPDVAQMEGTANGLSRDWVAQLSSAGAERELAIAELYGILLRAARAEVARYSAAPAQLSGADHDDIARESAGDAMISILRRLSDFRGESRFTTWAYKFVIVEAGVKLRRRAWQGREITLDAEQWPLLADRSPSPHQHAEAMDLLKAMREEIESKLSARQREVVVALALNEVPIDVLAERMNSSRGAIYKTLHDARQKLRSALAARGHLIDGDDWGGEGG
jgi:RNA polymerase sigma-70 factor, ECF subfamily